MKIPIPHAIANAWDIVGDWVNVDVIGPVRRIDVMLAAGGAFSVGYYGSLYGWLGALQGGAMYLLVMISALGMRQHD